MKLKLVLFAAATLGVTVLLARGGDSQARTAPALTLVDEVASAAPAAAAPVDSAGSEDASASVVSYRGRTAARTAGRAAGRAAGRTAARHAVHRLAY